MTLAEIRAYLSAEFPQVFNATGPVLEEADGGTAALVLAPDYAHLRPGGIISGPTLMMLADAAAYAALLSLSAGAMMAVTTNLSISFLRAAPPGARIRQSACVVKPGRRLSVVVAEAFDPAGTLLAHTTMTYAMPATDARVVS